MPIEKIASMLDDPAVSEELIRQQLQELLNKQQEIQGSIDLCRKLAADHASNCAKLRPFFSSSFT